MQVSTEQSWKKKEKKKKPNTNSSNLDQDVDSVFSCWKTDAWMYSFRALKAHI